jgi:predicted acyl esterase
MGAERWRYASTLEEVTSRHLPLYLHTDTNPTDVFRSGFLVDRAPGAGAPDRYVYDPRDMSRAKFESMLDEEKSLTDPSMVHALSGQSFTYHSLPFQEDTEVSGFLKFSAWISIDRPDTDVRVTLYEIGMDGSSTLLAADWIRAHIAAVFVRPSSLEARP